MALTLREVPPARGATWVREAFAVFGRRPMAFTGLFLVFMFVVMVTMLMSWVGVVLQAMLPPLASLGFMVATASALDGGPVQPGAFVEPFSATDGPRRRALLSLCLLYAVAAIGLLLLCDLIAGGNLAQLQAIALGGGGDPQQMAAIGADRSVFVAIVTGMVGFTLLSVPFWHAPALVHWGRQGVAQALFSSTLAVWRCKGAFLVYALVWSGLGMLASLALTLLSLLLAPALLPLLALPLGLVATTVFYVSLWFVFRDSFGLPGTTPNQVNRSG